MDPLYQLIANTTQRMQENTQRSSDSLRVQTQKEMKERGKRANELDSADLSGDLNLMGEDLMGSMDPDLFGGSNAAERFKRAWEEEPEEGPRREEQEGEGEPRDEHSEQQPGDEQPEPERPEAPVVEGQALERPLPPPPHVEEEEEDEPTPNLPDKPLAWDFVERRKRPRSERSPEDGVERRRPEQTVASPPEEARRDSSFNSLLDQSSGFLLAEGKGNVVRPGEAPMAVEEEDPIPELPPALAQLTARLISGDAGRPSFRRLEHLLSRFGAGVLRTCLNEKVRVFLLPPGEGLHAHPVVANLLGEEQVEGAVYLPESRAVVVEEHVLSEEPYGFHPVLFYFAHAFDHALGGESYASLKSAAVHASYQSCEQSVAGHRFADTLAAVSPVHYFAQAVESYLSAGDSREPLWTREDLYDFDRSMFDYVEYLLQRTNR